ncbi:MAG: hypothetical protein MJ252_22925 [archaeon]|nr:hypothetical protein [archaeon]
MNFYNKTGGKRVLSKLYKDGGLKLKTNIFQDDSISINSDESEISYGNKYERIQGLIASHKLIIRKIHSDCTQKPNRKTNLNEEEINKNFDALFGNDIKKIPLKIDWDSKRKKAKYLEILSQLTIPDFNQKRVFMTPLKAGKISFKNMIDTSTDEKTTDESIIFNKIKSSQYKSKNKSFQDVINMESLGRMTEENTYSAVEKQMLKRESTFTSLKDVKNSNKKFKKTHERCGTDVNCLSTRVKRKINLSLNSDISLSPKKKEFVETYKDTYIGTTYRNTTTFEDLNENKELIDLFFDDETGFVDAACCGCSCGCKIKK